MIDLSVIVATWKRPQLLTHTLNQYRRQVHGLRTECIVVSDGPSPCAAAIALHYGCRYIELPENTNDWGATPNDVGIAAAKGEYVAIWNDDDLYYERNLKCLHSAAQGVDIGVCQVVQWEVSGQTRIIPAVWDGVFLCGYIGPQCVCVRRETAMTRRWATPAKMRDCDYHWLRGLQVAGATTHFEAVVVGEHLPR